MNKQKTDARINNKDLNQAEGVDRDMIFRMFT